MEQRPSKERILVVDDDPKVLETVSSALRDDGFTADVAHELRTPLTAIRSIGESAFRRSKTPAALEEAIGSMLEEAERLGQTVDGLLFLSRAGSDHLSLERSMFTLASLTSEILSVLEILLEEHNIAIEEVNRQEDPALVYADRNLVRSALLNVLHNAVKYSPANGTIKITYVLHKQAGATVQRVCIEDQGPGVAPGEHARVFERLFRGRVQQGVSGLGLGLSIAKIAIEHSGGKIFLDESYPVGVRCCIDLPVCSGDLGDGLTRV